MKNIWVIISVALSMVFWGITFVVFKFANTSFQPITIIFIRLLISVVFLFIFAKLSGRLMKIRRNDMKWLFLMAFFEPFIYFLGEAFGLSMVSSTLAAIIIATIPLVVPIAAFFLLRERLSLINIVGLIISFGGVIMVIMASEGRFQGNINGILLMLLAVLAATGYTILAKKLIHTYNGIIITAWQSAFGAILITPLFLIFDLPDLQLSTVHPESIWAMLYLGIFGSSICFILFTTGIRELGASKANVYANLVPVVTAILSFLVLKEEMPFIKVAGIVVVLGGLFLSQKKKVKRRNGLRRWKNWFIMPRI